MHECVGGATFEVADAAGNVWFVRYLGMPLWFAFRERTAEELIEKIDESNAMLCSHVPVDRLSAAYKIALELLYLSSDMRPDKVQPRAERRKSRDRLLGMAGLLRMLLATRESLPMSFVRDRMAELQMPMQQVDHWKRYK
ncbi:MAG: hypothetical protein EOO27_19490 [Comamonadaceae bacterium]|nr:MAG: hypothetical protein EOO27_19490 [Comamonadaceae bacterium]